MVARKAALEAELARVTEELAEVRQELQSCSTQRNEAVRVQEEENAKSALERAKDRVQSQRVFKVALESCSGASQNSSNYILALTSTVAYNEKLTQAFQAEEKNLQKRLDDTTTQCVQSLMLHLELIVRSCSLGTLLTRVLPQGASVPKHDGEASESQRNARRRDAAAKSTY